MAIAIERVETGVLSNEPVGFIMSLEQEPIITNDEANFIAESGQPPLHVYGLLARIRHTGETLEVIYNQAISEPGNEEHIQEVRQARDFLAENSGRFGLAIPPEKSIST